MRVLFDGQVFVHQETGGISRYFANLVAQLAAMPDVQARILAPLHRNYYVGGLDGRLVLGTKAHEGSVVYPWTWHVTRALSPVIARLISADIVHETYFSPRPFIASARRRVTTVYDMVHEIHLKGTPETEHKRTAISRCDHVICISHSTRRDITEIFGLPAERSSTVHLGYQDFSSMLGMPLPSKIAGSPFVLYVGQRGGYKNFEGLLRAIATSQRLARELRILCFGGGRLTAREMTVMSDLGLGEHHVVQFAGPDELLATAYRQAVALVYPSLYEGFGLPVLEAMSAGCPVLCSNTSSLPEVVGDAAMTFDPADVEAIGFAVEAVMQSSALREEFVRRGHARRQGFSWQRCADETRRVYEQLM